MYFEWWKAPQVQRSTHCAITEENMCTDARESVPSLGVVSLTCAQGALHGVPLKKPESGYGARTTAVFDLIIIQPSFGVTTDVTSTVIRQ